MTSFLFECFHAGRARRQLRLKIFALQRHSPNFRLDLSDLLLSILKNEELFQFRMHAGSRY